jgi:hypothetical protein
MGKTPLKLPTGFSAGRSAKQSSANLANMYAEASPVGLSPVTLFSCPTPRIFSVVGGGQVRGQINAKGVHCAVIGSSLYTIASDGTATNRGTIDGTLLCDMAYDGVTVTIVSEIRAYAYNPVALVLLELLDPDLINPTSVCTLDQYTIFTRRGTGIIQWSELGDGTSYDGLDFAAAETSPDNAVAVRSAQQELVIFGEDSIEFFRNTGDPTQIFQRASGASPIEVGTVSRDCIAIMDNSFYWLGRDRNSNGLLIYRAEGYQARRISNHAIETLLESVPDISTVQSFAYAQQGHSYFHVTIPDVATLVYDAAGNEWHQRVKGSYPASARLPVADAGVNTFAMNGARPVQKPIVGSEDGNLYELTFDTFAQSGTTDEVSGGASYTFVAADAKKRKIRSHTTSMTDTLPTAGSAGFESGKQFYVKATGGQITITPSSGTINGAATLVVADGAEFRLVASGTNWLAYPYTHVGVVREITFAPVYSGNQLLTFSGFDLVCQTGGLVGPGDPEPMVELYWSDDGAETFKGGIARGLGAVGEREITVRWRQNMGRGRNRVFRIRIAAPVDFTVMDAHVYTGSGAPA